MISVKPRETSDLRRPVPLSQHTPNGELSCTPTTHDAFLQSGQGNNVRKVIIQVRDNVLRTSRLLKITAEQSDTNPNAKRITLSHLYHGYLSKE